MKKRKIFTVVLIFSSTTWSPKTFFKPSTFKIILSFELLSLIAS